MRAMSSAGSSTSAPFAFLADQGVGTHCDIRELDIGGVAAIDHPGAGDQHTLGFAIDQEERDAVAVPRRAGGARRNDQLVGHMAIQNEFLGARNGVAVSGVLRRRGDAVGVVLVRLLQCQGKQQFATRDLGQQVGLLRFATADIEYGAPQPDRGVQRARGQRPTGLFRDHAQTLVPEREAAMLLGERNARPAKFHHLRPNGAVVAVGAVLVAELAQLVDGRVVGAEVLGGVLQHVLFFVENHGHWRFLPNNRAMICQSRRK